MSHREAGQLHVIAGPMFAGKTEELLRRVHRARLAGLSVEVIGHRLDERGGAEQLSTHVGRTEPARMLQRPQDLLEALGGERPDLVAIDEAQFFGAGMVPVIEQLLAQGVRVVVAGLCVTYDGGPFEPLPSLMAQAEEVVKLTAVCTVCGADAAFHVRLRSIEVDALQTTSEQIGGLESYQARCRTHRRSKSGQAVQGGQRS